MPFVVGENIGPYRIVEQLGQGGMATVFKAYHPSLDRYVAIKALHPAFLEDPNFLARFQREARLVARLDHPNIVPIYDFAEHEGRPYLVMKFIEGETLKARLNRAPLTSREILQIVEAVGSALAYAHQRGILHRDVKPSNVLITSENQIYLADFGLARIAAAGESTLSSDMFIGTPQYISPEQAKGERNLDEGTDIYSFGVLIYELLVGKVPFSADTPYAIIHDHIFTPLPLPRLQNPKISEAVERVLLKALAKDREDRYVNVPTLVDALRKSLQPVDRGEPFVPVPGDTNTVVAQKPQETVGVPVNSFSSERIEATVASGEPEKVEPIDQRMDRETLILPEDVAAVPELETLEKSNAPPKKRTWVSWIWVPLVVVFCLSSLVVAGRRIQERREGQQTATAEFLMQRVAQSTEEAAATRVAAAITEVALPKPADSPMDYLDKAVALVEQNKFAEARDEYQVAFNKAGNNTEFYWGAGKKLADKGAWIAAAQVYIRLGTLLQKPYPPEYINAMHEAWYKAAKAPGFKEALPFEIMREIDPVMVEAAEARNLLFQNDVDKAGITIIQFIDRNPDYAEGNLLQIELALRWKQPQNARAYLEKLLGKPDVPTWIIAEARNIGESIKP